jgi:hypothetical protein
MGEQRKGAFAEPHDVPGIATAEGGLVILDGPGGLAVTLTPRAATSTGRSLLDAAARAEAITGPYGASTPTGAD